jgi:putative ABC transport system permease protein
VGTDTKAVSVADPARLTDVLDLDIRHGSVAALGPQQLAISQRVADDKGWTLGTPVPVMFPDGTTSPFTVGAIYRARDIAGNYIIPRPTWTAHAVQNLDTIVLIKLARGVPLERGRRAIEQAVRQYGSPDVQDRGQYTASLSRFVDTMLGIVYVLLALAIVIALMGIANTLSLSVYERTRELGLLRAIGETRSQLRSMIRWESAIIAAFGTVGGLLVGLFLGWALVQAASRGTADLVAPSFSAPVGRLVVLLVIGALAGVLAAVRPARRAARLPVLEAVSTA